ncbi:MAG: hypothetical protein KDI75_00190 [Xanthomonadales bacterium]|nr:hypothetical protein [Xanthomonadales bacterium]
MTIKPSSHRCTQLLLLALLLGSGLLLSACDSGSSPTQGSAQTPAKAKCTGDAARDPRDCALNNAIQAPLDKARAVEGQVLDAAKKQQEQIDAQSGG